MADDDSEVLMNARRVLVEMRHNWAKTIAAGYNQGETEGAMTALIEAHQAIEVIDAAIEELDEEE